MPKCITPSVPQSLSEVPGLDSDGFLSSFSANLVGGSIEGRFEGYLPSSFLIPSDSGFILELVTRGKAYHGLSQFNESIAAEKSRDDSREYALRLASSMHVEEFEFECWLPGRRRWSSPTAQWRFVQARNLAAIENTRRWGLRVGEPIPRPAQGGILPPEFKGDRWSAAYRDLEQLCITFDTVAGALPSGPVAESVAGAKAAMNDTLAEAARLSEVARKLEAVGSVQLQSKIATIADRLSGLHAWAVDVIEVLAEVHLEFPSDAASIEPSERLSALVSGLTEVRAITG